MEVVSGALLGPPDSPQGPPSPLGCTMTRSDAVACKKRSTGWFDIFIKFILLDPLARRHSVQAVYFHRFLFTG